MLPEENKIDPHKSAIFSGVKGDNPQVLGFCSDFAKRRSSSRDLQDILQNVTKSKVAFSACLTTKNYGL
jgi:hypothetical protein